MIIKFSLLVVPSHFMNRITKTRRSYSALNMGDLQISTEKE